MRRYLLWGLGLALLLLAGRPTPPSHAQNDEVLERAVQNLMGQLSPEQKVGQLFMVTFHGSYLGQDADITRLVRDYAIGGVLLSVENDNINGRSKTAERTLALTNGLQHLALSRAERQNLPPVPLFIAVEHAGNGLPETSLALASTPLPSYMALGATWQTEYAEWVGRITGEELTALGVNMLLGPSLDVLTDNPNTPDILGVQTFGGEPYWVGRMGQAYIRGVQTGSAGRLAVVPRHWPGLGASDRELSQEVPVVPRSAEELRRFDLVPFFSVMGSDNPIQGLQCANLRYQGENIRTETRPVCVDVAAFQNVINLAGYGAWRQEGLILSDSLGTRALRRWYAVEPFPHRQVARDAFLAGNDLLLLDNFGPQPDAPAFETIADTALFFAEGYRNDPIFAQRVDASVERILRHKLRLYGLNWDSENILQEASTLEVLGRQSNRLFQVAREAVTLLSPPLEQLPPPPQVGQRIVIFPRRALCKPALIVLSKALSP